MQSKIKMNTTVMMSQLTVLSSVAGFMALSDQAVGVLVILWPQMRHRLAPDSFDAPQDGHATSIVIVPQWLGCPIWRN